VAKRAAFLRRIRRIPAAKLVFLDESGLNLAMSRSHAWVKKGQEYVERTPTNWGDNLTLLGAIRVTGWVVLSTMFASTNKERFVRWLERKLLPRLKRGDVLVLDNLSAHHDVRVVRCARRVACASSTSRRTRPTSTRSSRAGRCRRRWCVGTHPGIAPRCCE
jgi:hypothetical protein